MCRVNRRERQATISKPSPQVFFGNKETKMDINNIAAEIYDK